MSRLRATVVRAPFAMIAMLSTFFALAAGTAAAATLKVPQQFTTIHDAIGAAGAGDTVLVAKGVYVENVFLKSDVTLIGKPGAIIDGGGVDSAITVGFSSHVVVRRFKVRNTGLEPGILVSLASDVEVSQCTVDAVDDHGIVVAAAVDVRILDNRVIGAGRTGILLQTDYALVSGNVVQQSTFANIAADGSWNTIADNVCEDAGGIASVGVVQEMFSTGFNLVVGNTVREPGVGQAGIFAVSRDSSIVDNAVLGAFEAGVVSFAERVSLLENTVKEADVGLAIESDVVSVRENRVSKTDEIGIRIAGSNVYAYRNSVKASEEIGVYVEASSEHCVLAQNSATGSGTVDLVEEGLDTVLIGNIFNSISS